MSKILARFKKNESGATAIEYGLIAALIAVAIIAGATTIGGQLTTTFENIGQELTDANTADE
jgi:pilus assembly protein Flp/PilA